MNNQFESKCATDKEIHDFLLSNKQRLSEKVLREFAKDRGIFCSNQDTREDLADYLSQIIHDQFDINAIVEKREGHNNREKTTFVTLKTDIESSDLNIVLTELQDSINEDREQKLLFVQNGMKKFTAEYSYTEYDFTKTRLMQRSKKDAQFEISLVDNEIKVRMPSSEKAKELTEKLKSKIEAKQLKPINDEKIELTSINSSNMRSQFFLRLISTMDGLNLEGVTSIRVASGDVIPAVVDDIDNSLEENDDEYSLDESTLFDTDQEDTAAEESAQMLSAVHRMVLDGRGLETSEEYQNLTRKGYFITSITWTAKETSAPYNKVSMMAGFEDPEECTSYRYSIKGVYKLRNHFYTKTLRSPSVDEKKVYIEAIEKHSKTILNQLISEQFDKDKGSL
tara:strand:- start:5179 stop:6363 length:1185 start_codon:yes stop_codon:yes gene_type:complete